MRFTITVALLIFAMSHGELAAKPPAQTGAGHWEEMYAKAAEAAEAGDYAAALAAITQLLNQDPASGRAQQLYWRLLARTAGLQDARDAMAQALEQFRQAPKDKRDAGYYLAFLAACEGLRDSACVAEAKRDALENDPAGALAHTARMEAAAAKEHPAEAAELYGSYYALYEEHPEFGAEAARARFELALHHAISFQEEALPRFADELESWSRRAAGRGGNPLEYLETQLRIAKGLLERHPHVAARHVDAGLVAINVPPEGGERPDPDFRALFLDLRLRAQLALKEWQQAAEAGADLTAALEQPTLGRRIRSQVDEPEARVRYGQALEGAGDLEAARAQFMWAAQLDPGAARARDAFFERHPLGFADRARLEEIIAQRIKQLRESRMRGITPAVSPVAVRRPAPEFTLPSVSGEPVTLRNFRGKTVVLTFWASWCWLCSAELEQWRELYTRHATNPHVAFLAINTDTERERATRHLQRAAYPFPVLFANEQVEQNYGARTLPLLYVVDPQGQIRFQQTGYSNADGDYQKRVEWMIQQAGPK